MLLLGVLRVFQSFQTSLHHQVCGAICKLPPPGLYYACFYWELLSIDVLTLGEDSLCHAYACIWLCPLCMRRLLHLLWCLDCGTQCWIQEWWHIPSAMDCPLTICFAKGDDIQCIVIYCEQELIKGGDHWLSVQVHNSKIRRSVLQSSSNVWRIQKSWGIGSGAQGLMSVIIIQYIFNRTFEIWKVWHKTVGTWLVSVWRLRNADTFDVVETKADEAGNLLLIAPDCLFTV